MKMKKTQSLKLMLLGLFALISTGAWAQFTQVNGVVYNVSGDKATVVGVLSTLPDGQFGDGRYVDGTKSIQIEDVVAGKKVDGLASTWKQAGKFANTTTGTLSGDVTNTVDNADGTQTVTVSNGGGTTNTTVYPTIDATQLTAVELVFRASEITEISRDMMKGLKVAGFILGGTSGITVIPDDLFAPVQTVTEVPNEAKAAEIARLEALINGSTAYYAPEGVYGSQQVYTTGTKYLVVDATRQTQVDGKFANAAFVISQEEGKEPKVATAIDTWVRTNENGQLVTFLNGSWIVYANPVTTDLFPYDVKGLADIADEKSKAYAKYDGEGNLIEGALKDYEDAKQATLRAAAALVDETYGYDPEKVEASKKAKALVDAINAFSGVTTSWTLLQAHIANDLLDNVKLPDEWYAAYVLATIDDWATEMPSLTDADKAYVGNKTTGLVKNFIDAYVAYFGYAPQALQQTEVQAYSFTSYAAAGDIFDNLASSENLHQLATGLVEDRSTDTADQDAVITITSTGKKYYKVKVLQNSVDAANWEGKAFYVQLPDDKSIVTDTYYVLYTLEAPAEGSSDPTMKPVTFTTNVVTSPATEAQTVQLTATANSDNSLLSFFANGVNKGSLAVSNSNPLNDNARIKVGEDYIAVTRVYIVEDEGDWNGRYYIDANGKLYKQTDAAIAWNNGPGGILYHNAEASMFTIPGTDAVTSEQTATIVVNINPTPETYEYTLSPKDQKPNIDAADPRPELATVIITYPSDTQRQTTYNDAVAAEATAKTAAETAKGQMDIANGNLKGANDELTTVRNEWDDTIDEVRYDADGQNEDLMKGAFNNDIVSVGDHAFAQCVNAKFDGTFRKNIVSIGEEAFLNTLFENLDLSQTGLVDLNGDGEITSDEKLGNDAIGMRAFKGTPLKTALFATTALTPAWVSGIFDDILYEDVDFTDECGNPYTRNVNKTLTTVTLPVDKLYTEIASGTLENCIALTEIAIPAQVVTIGKNAFCGADALAKIIFADTESELTTIGEGAFYHVAAPRLSLSKQTNLANIADYAFADMKNLTAANFRNTAIKTLPAHVFEGDSKLESISFYDASDAASVSLLEYLPAGIFRTNILKTLDLGKTNIADLENLFQAGIGAFESTDCNGNAIVLDPVNETLKSIVLPENLLKIEDYALANLWGLTYTVDKPLVVPSSVITMGEGVFFNDKNLVAVSIMDSEMCGLPKYTFKSCNNLEAVYFITLNTIGECESGNGFGDNIFESAGIDVAGASQANPIPKVYVGYDSYKKLDGSTVVFSSTYAKLMPYETTLTGTKIGDRWVKPWTSKYGTWVEADGNTGVFTAYQNGEEMILYPAKKNSYNGKDYYKIAAFDKDVAYGAMEYEFSKPVEGYIYKQTLYGSVDGVQGEPTIVETTYWAVIDGELTQLGWSNRRSNFYYPYNVYGNDRNWLDSDNYATWRNTAIELPEIVESPEIPAEIEKLIKARLSFGSLATTLNGIVLPTEVLAKGWMALGTAIILTTNDGGKIKNIQKTNKDQKYQSTLDLANQLVVAPMDIPANNANHIYYYGGRLNGSTVERGFIHHNDPSIRKYIREGGVCFWKTAENGQGARDFIDVVVVSEEEATAIGGVTDYISAKNSDAIYNLQGVRVIAPVKGQMYIQGGKKFIQK